MPEDLPIKGLRLPRFRTLADIEMVCDGRLTVVCGPNNSGKSSLLSALDFCSRVGAANWLRVDEHLPGAQSFELAVSLRGERWNAAITGLLKPSGSEASAFADALVDALGSDLLWFPFEVNDSGATGQAFSVVTQLDEALSRLTGSGARDSRDPARRFRAALHSQQQTGAWQQSTLRVLSDLVQAPTIRHIADVRRVGADTLGEPEMFEFAKAAAHNTAGQKKEAWTRTFEYVLRDVFGSDVVYEVNPLNENRARMYLKIDGQLDVPLEQVGAGVREVVAVTHQALSSGGTDVLTIEEPENCLHPQATRRLIDSLLNRTAVQLFVSTHAAAVVNARASTVVQLIRSDSTTTARQVRHARQRFEAVAALGAAPGDLVLARTAVWVEGPSDRLYFNRWLGHHGLIEGVDYVLPFYAGALGVHVTLDAETSVELSDLRALARRCAVVADSDRGSRSSALKPHVQRWLSEKEGDDNALVLVTPGREVENLLPLEVINEVRADAGVPAMARTANRFTRVFDKELGGKLTKVEFARRALAVMGDTPPPNAVELVGSLAAFVAAG